MLRDVLLEIIVFFVYKILINLCKILVKYNYMI